MLNKNNPPIFRLAFFWVISYLLILPMAHSQEVERYYQKTWLGMILGKKWDKELTELQHFLANKRVEEAIDLIETGTPFTLEDAQSVLNNINDSDLEDPYHSDWMSLFLMMLMKARPDQKLLDLKYKFDPQTERDGTLLTYAFTHQYQKGIEQIIKSVDYLDQGPQHHLGQSLYHLNYRYNTNDFTQQTHYKNKSGYFYQLWQKTKEKDLFKKLKISEKKMANEGNFLTPFQYYLFQIQDDIFKHPALHTNNNANPYNESHFEKFIESINEDSYWYLFVKNAYNPFTTHCSLQDHHDLPEASRALLKLHCKVMLKRLIKVVKRKRRIFSSKYIYSSYNALSFTDSHDHSLLMWAMRIDPKMGEELLEISSDKELIRGYQKKSETIFSYIKKFELPLNAKLKLFQKIPLKNYKMFNLDDTPLFLYFLDLGDHSEVVNRSKEVFPLFSLDELLKPNKDGYSLARMIVHRHPQLLKPLIQQIAVKVAPGKFKAGDLSAIDDVFEFFATTPSLDQVDFQIWPHLKNNITNYLYQEFLEQNSSPTLPKKIIRHATKNFYSLNIDTRQAMRSRELKNTIIPQLEKVLYETGTVKRDFLDGTCEPQEDIPCMNCFEKVKPILKAVPDKSLCQECLVYFKNQTKGGHFPPLEYLCRKDQILSSVDYDKLKQFNFTDEEILTIRQFEIKKRLDKVPNFHFCRSSNCFNGKVLKKDDLTLLHCSLCGESKCLLCGENHGGKGKADCAKFGHLEKEFNEELHNPKSDYLRPCAYCFKACSKDEHCSTITCSFCQKTFDWVDGRVVRMLHRFGVDKWPRRYRVPGDPLNSHTPHTSHNTNKRKTYTKYQYIGNNPANQNLYP